MDARTPVSARLVLVVEDEPFTRLMAADVLAKAGFAVLEAGNAGEALKILEAGVDVRAVVTDVDMPGSFDGLELAQRIGERWPEISILITSGHASYLERILGKYRFLAKPYAGPELIRQIREGMHATPAADFTPHFSNGARI
jgi:two-component system, response regulator PdtaR